METSDHSNPTPFLGIALPGCSFPPHLAWRHRQASLEQGLIAAQENMAAPDSRFGLLSLPQPDHFVQDPAVLREKAEARRMAFLAKKG